MNDQINQSLSPFAGAWQAVAAYVQDPWLIYQVVILAALLVASWLVGAPVERWLEARARNIKGQPRLLRTVIVLIRRTNWIVFTVFAWIATVTISSLTWPSRKHLISLALSLAIAWIAIAVFSRVIRNRVVARTVAMAVWAFVAMQILGVTDDVVGILDNVAVSVGDVRLSALLLLKGIVLLGVSLWLAIVIGGFIDERIQRSEELTPSLRVLIGKLVKISLTIIAVVTAMSAVGVDLTAFTVFSGAVGVGVGFGLQKVVSNFISGIIILLDRSIKPGDTISLGETFGWIRELRARFVSVVTRDGREYLIPNEDFITTQVINWSFSNDLVRLDVPFGVSYKSDPHLVSKLAIEACASVERVNPTQRPVCWMTGFGDSSLDFLLRFWIRDPQNGLTNIRGKVLLALWDTFKEHDIEIPFPHRDILFRADGALPPAISDAIAALSNRNDADAREADRRNSRPGRDQDGDESAPQAAKKEAD